jgi:hypothetical protein
LLFAQNRAESDRGEFFEDFSSLQKNSRLADIGFAHFAPTGKCEPTRSLKKNSPLALRKERHFQAAELRPRVARFFMMQSTKNGKKPYQMATNC